MYTQLSLLLPHETMVRSHMFPHAVGPGRAEPEPGWYWFFFLNTRKGHFLFKMSGHQNRFCASFLTFKLRSLVLSQLWLRTTMFVPSSGSSTPAPCS